MKIIINESQLRLIVENTDKLLHINMDILINMGLNFFVDYFKKKSSKYSGIYFEGDLKLNKLWDYFEELSSDEVRESTKYICDNLVVCSGELNIQYFGIKSFPKLREVGAIYCGGLGGDDEILDFPNLERIINFGFFNKTGEVLLPKLEVVDGDLYLYDSGITQLPKLRSAGYLNLVNAIKIKSLPELVQIKKGEVKDDSDESLLIGRTNISDLPKLEFVGFNLDMERNWGIETLEQLPNLKFIGGHFYLKNSTLSNYASEDDIRDKVAYVRFIDLF